MARTRRGCDGSVASGLRTRYFIIPSVWGSHSDIAGQ